MRGANNAIYIEGPSIGQLLFSGPGAGGEPTSTAVLGDVIDAARELLAGAQVAPRVRFAPGRVRDIAEVETRWYLRLEVVDAPGVLAEIASVFGRHQVSIASVWQEGPRGRGDASSRHPQRRRVAPPQDHRRPRRPEPSSARSRRRSGLSPRIE